MAFVRTFVVMFIAWLAFTFSLAPSELAIGAICSIAVAYISEKFSFGKQTRDPSHVSLFSLPKFVLFFITAEISSHLSVAKAVVTGKISPAILRVDSGVKTPGAKTFLSSSITLTPGTLSVDMSEEGPLYIHYLNSGGGVDTEQKFVSFAEKIFGEGSA